MSACRTAGSDSSKWAGRYMWSDVRLLPGPGIDPDRDAVALLTRDTAPEIGAGVFLGETVDEGQIGEEGEVNDFAAHLKIPIVVGWIKDAHGDAGIGAQVAVLHRFGFDAEQQVIVLPQEPDRIDLRLPGWGNGREVAESASIQERQQVFANGKR